MEQARVKKRDTERSGRNLKGWLIGGGAVVVLAGAYAGGAALVGDQIPQGSSVHGVQIGGLDAADASDEALIDAMLAHPVLMNRPFVVTPKGVRLCRPPETLYEIL